MTRTEREQNERWSQPDEHVEAGYGYTPDMIKRELAELGEEHDEEG